MTMLSKARLIALGTLAAMTLAACDGASTGPSGDAVAKIAAPAGQKWSEVVRATQDGFVMGNPDAPLKLIEFASPTCSHCAEFSRTGAAALKSEFVDSGRVSLEIRPFLINPLQDSMIAATLTCAGTDRFFPLLENVYASQEELFGGFQNADEAAVQAAANLPPDQRFGSVANAIGISTFFAARGIPAEETARCLSNPAAIEKFNESTQRNSTEFEISGTPTFVLNGEVLEGAGTWEALRERLMAAGAR